MTIEIKDLNDHRPVFTPAEIVHELSESSQPGTTSFVIPTANDNDSLPLSIKEYLLQPANVDEDTGLFQPKVNDKSALLSHVGPKYCNTFLHTKRKKHSKITIILRNKYY